MTAARSQDPAELVEAGRQLHRAGQLADAERLYAQALAADEEYAEAHQLMAVIAGQRGQFDQAIRGFRRAIGLEGPTRDRLYNLAEAYRVTGAFQDALEAYNQALTLDAGDIDTYRRCAAMAKEAAERARSAGDAASERRLSTLAAHYLLGLGHICLRSENMDEGEQAYRESAALDPARAETFNCLGAIAIRSHRPVEAEALQRRAAELEPKTAVYLNNLGVTLLNQLRIEEAADLFRQALDADSSYADAKLNLEERTLPWLRFRMEPSPQAIVARHREWGHGAVAQALKDAGPPPPFANDRDPDRPLRVAYTGVDTTSRLLHGFFEPLLANHDPSAVQPAIFISSGRLDADLKRLQTLAGRSRRANIGRPKDIAKAIRQDDIDIMVDVAGHSSSNRLDVFAHKPAPVAATWLAYPGTSGLSSMDYRITDEVADPQGAEEFYTERLYRLRGGSFAYRPPKSAPAVAPLRAREAGAVTFGNFDDPRKISPETLTSWSSILRALPQARLLLLAPEFADPEFAERLHAEFRGVGIDIARVELRRAPKERDAYLPLYAEVDISLDTFPFNADLTTICESLWMGVPVITLSGDRPWARTSASVLAQVGLERLNSETAEEYGDTAVELASDPPRLRTLREGMRERMRVSPLMDERDFARRFEAALRDMWRRWCQSPA